MPPLWDRPWWVLLGAVLGEELLREKTRVPLELNRHSACLSSNFGAWLQVLSYLPQLLD
jgi:hypothetical protein